MPIIIKGIKGHHVDQVYDFDENKKEIRFGRSQVSDILFPPDNVSISRQHLSLELENDRYKIRMQADNPVYLDGEEAFPNDEIPLGQHRLTVGMRDSPEQFELTVTSQDEHMAVTEPSYKVKKSASKQNKKLFQLGSLSVVALLLVGGLGFHLLYQTSSEIDSTVARLAEQSEKANARARFEQVVLSRRDSVYLVAIKNGDSVIGQGTAWVVGDGQLATNAHVVEGLKQAFEESNGALRAVVVSPSAPDYTQHNVTGMQFHPHYEAFTEHQNKVYRLLDDGSELHLTPAYDVAVLTVDQPEKLARPLAIAERPDLLALDSGAPLAYIGYPMEDAAGGGVNFTKPTPQIQFGAVTSATDYFMVSEDRQRNHLIQHSLPAHGGASGSPIFDLNGNVVALFNAGNVVFVEGYRIATGIGVNFAQRADVLTELMENRVGEIEPARFAFWGERLSQYKTPTELILQEWKLRLQQEGVNIESLTQETQTLEMSQYSDEHEIHFWEGAVKVTEGERMLLIAEPHDSVDLDLAWFDLHDDRVADDTSGEPFAIVDSNELGNLSDMVTNRLLVYSTSDPSTFNLTIYRVKL